MMRWTRVMVLALVALATLRAGSQETDVQALIQRAGNAEDDGERLALLRKLAATEELGETLQADTQRLIAAVEKWIEDPNLTYFGRDVMKNGRYDFGIAEDSPLYPITLIYQARMLTWVTLEHGGYWSDAKARREQFDKIRPMFEAASKAFPKNRVLRMYLGEQMPPARELTAPPNAPAWAVHQREALERLADIITWWIDHRMQDNGEYGGGWGDDCEMWRWWVPVLIAFDDPKITAAQARFSEALFAQPHMAKGYTSHVYDVEHTGEDSSDALTPMMHLEPDKEAWKAKALRLVELMEGLWTGENERGFLQFKSTYFGADKVSDDPRKACDTVYHPRAMQPALLYWQRTQDPRLTALFTRWMDTWADAAARAERGKPAGIIPSAIHWPDGGIGGMGERWWDPENHTNDPLYVWPSAMGLMTNALLLTHHVASEEKYLEPLRTMAQARLAYLKDPPSGTPEAGSLAWCASKLGGMRDVLAKYRLLTGNTEFDELLERDAGAYLAFRLHGDEETLTKTLETTAKALRINFPGYTSEVRYTDRVLRFPSMFGDNAMYEKALDGFDRPDTNLLYATATGDPGSAIIFPTNAVRWLTPPRDIAVRVCASERQAFRAELYHFGENERSLEAEFYLLAAGDYTVRVSSGMDGKVLSEHAMTVSGARARTALRVPSRQLVALEVIPSNTTGKEPLE